jgi:hypothetical protein
MTVPINHFNRGKPFYPLVMNYLVQLLGFKEISVRDIDQRIARGLERFARLGISVPTPGRVQRIELPPISTDLEQNLAAELNPLRESITQLNSAREKLLGSLQLRCDFQGNHIEIDPDSLAKDLVDNHTYIISFVMRSAGSLLILAYEMCKSYQDQSPLWEFLRHCRHAAAHGGSFNFLHDEPRRLAQWGHFQIERSMQGTPLFKRQDGVGLLSPGDPIRLLWDIEQAYPQMCA